MQLEPWMVKAALVLIGINLVNLALFLVLRRLTAKQREPERGGVVVSNANPTPVLDFAAGRSSSATRAPLASEPPRPHPHTDRAAS